MNSILELGLIPGGPPAAAKAAKGGKPASTGGSTASSGKGGAKDKGKGKSTRIELHFIPHNKPPNHLPDPDDLLNVRHNATAVVIVDTHLAVEQGAQFYYGTEGVVLSPSNIPSDAIHAVWRDITGANPVAVPLPPRADDAHLPKSAPAVPKIAIGKPKQPQGPPPKKTIVKPVASVKPKTEDDAHQKRDMEDAARRDKKKTKIPIAQKEKQHPPKPSSSAASASDKSRKPRPSAASGSVVAERPKAKPKLAPRAVPKLTPRTAAKRKEPAKTGRVLRVLDITDVTSIPDPSKQPTTTEYGQSSQDRTTVEEAMELAHQLGDWEALWVLMHMASGSRQMDMKFIRNRLRNYIIFILTAKEGQPLIVSQQRWSETVIYPADEDEVREFHFVGAPELDDLGDGEGEYDDAEWTKLEFMEGSDAQAELFEVSKKIVARRFDPLRKPANSAAASSSQPKTVEKRRRTRSPEPAEEVAKSDEYSYDEEGEEESPREGDEVIEDDDEDGEESDPLSDSSSDSDDQKSNDVLWSEFGVEAYDAPPGPNEQEYWSTVLTEHGNAKNARSLPARIKRARRENAMTWLRQDYGMTVSLKDAWSWIPVCPYDQHYNEDDERVMHQDFEDFRHWAKKRRADLKARKSRARRRRRAERKERRARRSRSRR